METVSITWQGITGLVLSSTLLTAILTKCVDSWFAKRQTNKSSKFTALRAAIVLEQYAIQCADNISKSEILSGGRDAEVNILPTLPAFPKDLEWKHVNPELTAKALGFESMVLIASGTIKYQEALAPITLLSESTEQCVKCGYEASLIAHALRKAHGLPEYNPVHSLHWEPFKSLKQQHDVIVEKDKERLIHAKEWLVEKARGEKAAQDALNSALGLSPVRSPFQR